MWFIVKCLRKTTTSEAAVPGRETAVPGCESDGSDRETAVTGCESDAPGRETAVPVVKATPLIVKLPFRAMMRWHPGRAEADAMGRLWKFVNFAAVSIKEIYYEDGFCNR